MFDITQPLPTSGQIAKALTVEEIRAFKKVVEQAEWDRRFLDRKAAEEQAKRDLENSPERRFKKAVSALRKAGFKWHTNVKACCRGCVTPEQLGLKDDEDKTTQYGWTYGGQGCNIRWDAQGQPEREMSRNRWEVPSHDPITTYVYHGNGAGAVIADAFREQGFQVDWDGSVYSAVEVVLS